MPRKPAEQAPIDRYRDMSGLKARYPRDRKTLKRWVAEGILPPPDLVVANKLFWKESSLNEADKKNTIQAGATTEFGRRRRLTAAE